MMAHEQKRPQHDISQDVYTWLFLVIVNDQGSVQQNIGEDVHWKMCTNCLFFYHGTCSVTAIT